MSLGFRDQIYCVVSSVSNSMEITASNFSKQRPLMIPTGVIEFPQNKINTHCTDRGACGSHTQLHQTH